MPRFLVQASYSVEGMSALIGSTEDRSEAIRQVIENAGGELNSLDYSFGDHDVVFIAELPDNITMVAISMAVSARGAVKDVKTTPLLSMDEAMEAMRKAGSVGYQPPRQLKTISISPLAGARPPKCWWATRLIGTEGSQSPCNQDDCKVAGFIG